MNKPQENADVINTPPIQKSRMRRCEIIIQLRKSKKTKLGLFKRRNINNNNNNELTNNENPKEHNNEDGANPMPPVQELELSLDEIIDAMNASDNPERQLIGMHQARKMLSRENQPPIDLMISHGIVPICIRFIRDSSNTMLQFEAAWALTKIVSGTSEQTRCVIDENGVPHLIALLESKSIKLAEQAVWALGNIAGDGAAARDIVIQHNCIDGILRLIDNEDTSIKFLRNIVWLMSNLCRNKNPSPPVEHVKLLLPVLSKLLLSNDDRVLIDSCWALVYVTDDDNNMIQEVVETDAVARLVDLLETDNTSIIMPALRSIGNIVTGTDEQTDIVIRTGALPKLGMLLRHSQHFIVKEAAWTVSNITAGSREQIQAVFDAGIFHQICHVLDKGDFKAQKEAAWTVFNTITSGRHEQVFDLVNEYRILKPYLNLLACKDSRTIKVVLTGLRNFFALAERSGYIENFCLMVDELGGLTKLRALQYHGHEEVKGKANNIINTYYQNDNDWDVSMEMDDI